MDATDNQPLIISQVIENTPNTCSTNFENVLIETTNYNNRIDVVNEPQFETDLRNMEHVWSNYSVPWEKLPNLLKKCED